MVDLETLGNGSNAVIVSIGAVEFDNLGVGREFYALIDPQSCVDIGMQIDASTVLWWMKQPDDARKALTAGGHVPIKEALFAFTNWMREVEAAYVWGNGATFDNVILANAYRKADIPQPWKYYNDRCYRTLKNLYPTVEQPADIGTAHNALDDAKWQAQHAVNIINYIYGRNFA